MSAAVPEIEGVAAAQAAAAGHAERCLLSDLRGLVQRARTEDLFAVDAAVREVARGYAELMVQTIVEVAETVRLHCELEAAMNEASGPPPT